MEQSGHRVCTVSHSNYLCPLPFFIPCLGFAGRQREGDVSNEGGGEKTRKKICTKESSAEREESCLAFVGAVSPFICDRACVKENERE